MTTTEHPTRTSAHTDPDPDLDATARTAARVAGLGYVALFFLAIFANFFVREGLVDSGDPTATVQNIAADEQLFRTGLWAFVAIFVIDVAVAWGLYVILRPAGVTRSLLAAWFRLTYTVLLGVAATFLYLALQLATDGGLVGGLDAAERAAWTDLAVQAFDYTWMVGLVAFGLHLVVVGRLLTRAMGAPLLGAALVVAGAAYVFDTSMITLYADYSSHEDLFLAIVAIPSVVAEMGLGIWLLRRGLGRRITRVNLAQG